MNLIEKKRAQTQQDFLVSIGIKIAHDNICSYTYL
mgnify:CR=1 FL=1